MRHFDIAVAGAGLAGSLSAVALAKAGYHVALIAPPTERTDGRTTALMDQSIAFLKTLNLWDSIEPQAAALETMQIIDGTSRLLRAPTVAFRAQEVDLNAFGYNIPNAAFTTILETEISANHRIERISTMLRSMALLDSAVELTLETDEVVTADLIVGADGRGSRVRECAGIAVKTWTYPQSALVLNFTHSRPHNNISTEFHTEYGPFTQVPLPGKRSSLVWVRTPQDAQAALAMTTDELSADIETRMQSMLGAVEIDGGVQSYPLSGMTANQCGRGRAVLIGEAAHAFPPIGAQGLNLSLRDLRALLEIVGQRADTALQPNTGDAFAAKRKVDIMTRTASVDLLNRSLLSSFLPVQMVRAAGLQALSTLSPLRNFIMREGIEPGGALRAISEKLGFRRRA
ncbi:UbiH/UbiF family hydroxylase [Rhizobium sp. CFBP 8762]|uniref:UbiH/UbiF family hydroxylase n=1 Tax=Rhizobium sp. CFBP 8762 TaxID=2775279 RepID=UPI001785A2A7|nr:UbiH/UbiF family hydroxylase [Rhizobium sp. CFBP 8762]MBD8554658.1 UbiH/UbiF family hydroxylase [Rhizobium sp. CFBP 8762]